MNSWRSEILEALSHGGDVFQNGAQLAERFGCSRTAVWKKINILRGEGYPIEAVTNRGYRLIPRAAQLENEISAGLHDAGLHHQFAIHVHNVVTSTNQTARESGMSGAPENDVIVALSQTHGKGRMGRTWESGTSEGLWFSVLLRPEISPEKTGLLSLLFGLCVCKALQDLYSLHAGIKWPNDIISLVTGKKICGILSETVFEDNKLAFAVVGCGINILQKAFPESISERATSLLLEGVKQPSIARTMVQILKNVSEEYPAFIRNPSVFIDEYRKNCVTLGREIRAEGATEIRGMATNITDHGELEVTCEDGQKVILSAGEVSVRGILGYS
jgi:BirA family biotin operon repressor/biotin-[acetyl-CoA-carboxylase] ligase